MKKLVSIALCSFAALAFSFPAEANEAAKAKAGAGASVEGGASLGGTGVSAGVGAGTGGTVEQKSAGSPPRTGDAQARSDNVQDEEKNKRKGRAQRRDERDAASTGGTSSKSY